MLLPFHVMLLPPTLARTSIAALRPAERKLRNHMSGLTCDAKHTFEKIVWDLCVWKNPGVSMSDLTCVSCMHR